MSTKTKKTNFIEKHKTALISLSIFILSLMVIGRNIGLTALHPWDEAWYAEIARNMVQSGDLLNMHQNGQIYWDHPPLGFYAIALSYKVLGVSEFSTRIPMVIFGSIAVVFAYLSGLKLKNHYIGIAAALIMLSTRWFLFRAQTGNLDALLIATQIAVFYFSINIKTNRQLYLLWFSYALALMSKSAISVTLAPLVLLSTFDYHRKYKLTLQSIVFSIYSFALPILPWYLYNYIIFGDKFLQRNIFTIGLRSGSASGVSIESVTKTLLYLRSAIHKWYLPLLISSFGSVLFIFSKQTRQVLFYLFLTSFPYFVSTQTEIWHLIPITSPASLIIPLFIVGVFELLSKLTKKITSVQASQLTLVLVLIITILITKDLSKEPYSGLDFDSPSVLLSKAAVTYGEPLYLEALKDFSTTVIFYSHHVAIDLNQYDPDQKNGLNTIKLPVLLMASQDFIDKNLKNFKYEIIETAGSTKLVRIISKDIVKK